MAVSVFYFSRQVYRHWKYNGQSNPETKKTVLNFVLVAIAFTSFILLGLLYQSIDVALVVSSDYGWIIDNKVAIVVSIEVLRHSGFCFCNLAVAHDLNRWCRQLGRDHTVKFSILQVIITIASIVQCIGYASRLFQEIRVFYIWQGLIINPPFVVGYFFAFKEFRKRQLQLLDDGYLTEELMSESLKEILKYMLLIVQLLVVSTFFMLVRTVNPQYEGGLAPSTRSIDIA
jgi:uncharacterized protein with PQ loop repeat